MSTETKPTLVFVHGAFADSSSWNGVIAPLLDLVYPVVAAANPLRCVKGDAASVGSALQAIDGPVVLIGHSYGGMVISNVNDSKVKGLVFIAAFAPEVGESAAALSGRFPGSSLGPTLSQVALPGGDADLSIQPDKFWAQFAADVPQGDARLMAATQRPITGSALNEPSGDAAWKTLPSWFLFGSLDRNIPAAAQRFMAERAQAQQPSRSKAARTLS
jgi:pimeloyl-ACP methyl ester carboxylesterase